MKRKWKRGLSILLCGVSIVLMGGCGSKEYFFSDYANGKEMYLGVFSSPLPNQQSYDECAAAGFNHVLMDETFDNTRGSALQEQTLQYCYNSDITALVMTSSFQNTHDETVDHTDYSKFEAYGGSFFYDEPYPNSFDYIAEAIPEFEQKYPDKTFMVNLHPCTVFLEEKAECNYNGKQYTYEEYLSEFKTKVLDKLSGPKMLSVDIYPLIDGNGRDNRILQQYLYNLEATAKLARGTDLMTHYYILTHGHGVCRAITSVADINFQYYTAMAYGVQGFSCFTYKQQKGSDGVGNDFAGNDGLVNWDITEKGVTSYTTDIYDFAKEANEKLRSFENVYLAFDWQKTMAIGGSESGEENACYTMLTENATKLEGISSISATQDTLVGYFLDGNNTKGYMVTNFSEPSKGLTDEVVVELKDATKVRVYQNGEMQELKPKNGKVKLTLSAGEGAFVLAI